ncbi:hypothetical protein BD413DRAFT_33703 [Trametes elegans]|nr:hypothetical protein BD413DRAFT_33703 [Trametes elegans]
MWGYNIVFPWVEYARAIHLFLAGHGRGVDVDFSSRKLVGVEACVGSIAIILSQTYQPALKYVSLVLVEPTFNPFPTDPESRVPSSLYEPLLKQKDI